ncbi:hypothetical protein ACFPES_09860 [Paenibacillus sp. GCM10023248]|nr:hypothetical protein [Paenibacillus sp. MAHUQ-63]MDD9267325.1 hypothetical protein [Paenibacillus sp. MAHUQ-63]
MKKQQWFLAVAGYEEAAIVPGEQVVKKQQWFLAVAGSEEAAMVPGSSR